MRDIISSVDRWILEGKQIAVALVVRTWGSSPRGVGARMAFTRGGEFAGSVSGGCVEAAVITAGEKVLKGEPPQLLHFDVADETAWGVGLTCGGSLDVFVSRFDATILGGLRVALGGQQPTSMISVIQGPAQLLGRVLLLSADGTIHGSLGGEWDPAAVALAQQGLERIESAELELADGIRVFRDVFPPQPSLIMVGGVHVARALVPLARILGWRTIMVDPRKAWANSSRFADVDQLLQLWPQAAFEQIPLNESSAAVTLTHDPKVDDAALLVALRSPAFYVGALGSATSQEKRRIRLLRSGLTEAELSRLHAPVGLQIGAQSPEEIALAIMSQVISEYRARSHRRIRAEHAAVMPSPVPSGTTQ